MKKVVINADYGGFNLTPEALAILHMMGFPMKGEPLGKDSLQEEEFTLEGPNGYRGHSMFGAILKDGLTYNYLDFKNDFHLRSHPILVKVVETLGRRADKYGDLRIKELPDEAPYTIETYDGKETLKDLSAQGYVSGYVYTDVPLPPGVQLSVAPETISFDSDDVSPHG